MSKPIKVTSRRQLLKFSLLAFFAALMKPFKALAQAGNTALFWRRSTVLYGAGYSSHIGDSNNVFTVGYRSPRVVGSADTWLQITAGSGYCLAIKQEGSLWAWGGANAALGLNNTGSYSSPVQVGTLRDWSKVVTGGGGLTLAIKKDGTLWSWGNQTAGELGQNISGVQSVSSPVKIGALTTWTDIAVGSAHCAAIKGGELWTWGDGGNGRLGNASGTNRSSPIRVGALTTWTKVFCGNQQTYALISSDLYAFGVGTSGELGINNNVNKSSPWQIGTNYSSVAGSSGGAWAISTAGTLWGWGINSGNLGNGDATVYSSPVQIGNLTTWKSISASLYSAACTGIRTDGKLYAWGYNTMSNGAGGLGLNGVTTNPVSSPHQVGSETTWVASAISDTNSWFIR